MITPGKWSVEIRGTKSLDVVAMDGPNYAAICRMYDQCEIPDVGEPTREESNAYLIAAAPALLAACQTALEMCRKDNCGRRVVQPALEAAIAAVLPPKPEAT